jgi:thiol-disulfide isomerase/thioredoxin
MRTACWLAALVLAGGPAWAAQAPSVPAAAPVFELPGSAGTVKLADFRGKVVYLDFWASWCGPCRQSFPWMNAMAAQHRAAGLEIVAVNVDTSRPEADRFLAEVPAHFTIAFDPAGSTPRQYAIKGMPSSVLIDRAGRVIWRHAGFNVRDKPDIEHQIEAALAAARESP